MKSTHTFSAQEMSFTEQLVKNANQKYTKKGSVRRKYNKKVLPLQPERCFQSHFVKDICLFTDSKTNLVTVIIIKRGII